MSREAFSRPLVTSLARSMRYSTSSIVHSYLLDQELMPYRYSSSSSSSSSSSCWGDSLQKSPSFQIGWGVMIFGRRGRTVAAIIVNYRLSPPPKKRISGFVRISWVVLLEAGWSGPLASATPESSGGVLGWWQQAPCPPARGPDKSFPSGI